jgi:hypothetical protein
MDPARVKAIELAILAIQCGFMKDGGEPIGLLEAAESIRAWIDPPASEVSPADGEDYPRMGTGQHNSPFGNNGIPDRF